MTASELIAELRSLPDLMMEVHIEVKGVQSIATAVDWETGGVSAWAVITDYPVNKDD